MKKTLTIVLLALGMLFVSTPANAAPTKPNPAWVKVCYHSAPALVRDDSPRDTDSLRVPIYPQRCTLVHRNRLKNLGVLLDRTNRRR